MRQKVLSGLIPKGGRLLIAALIITGSFMSCKWLFPKKVVQDKMFDRISWNVLFKDGISTASRADAIAAIQDSLTNYYLINFPGITPKFDFSLFCICDSSLYNLNIRFVGGAGESVSSPPPPPPGPNGSGDFLNVLQISQNIPIVEILEEDSIIPTKKEPIDEARQISPIAVLAVIDTGIDTTLFKSGIGRLIWRSNGQQRTLFNFLPGENIDQFKDDHKQRHGTGVTALALQSMQSTTAYPKIMVLKALDSLKRGTIFSVSCAMSYAIQNRATLINASLGYYGTSDPILRNYFEKTLKLKADPIPVFVSAGNVLSTHDQMQYCKNVTTNDNELGANNKFFYPACFTREFSNVTAVTSLNSVLKPCYYQNYSTRFVSLGVFNPSMCCQYAAAFMSRTYEGSSFATPVASGKMIDCMIRNNFVRTAIISDWNNNIIKHVPIGVTRSTVDGRYIEFKKE